MSTARLSPLQRDTFVRLRAAHLANMRTLAAHRKQRIADLQARAHVLTAMKTQTAAMTQAADWPAWMLKHFYHSLLGSGDVMGPGCRAF